MTLNPHRKRTQKAFLCLIVHNPDKVIAVVAERASVLPLHVSVPAVKAPLVAQPFENLPRGMPLFGRGLRVLLENPIDEGHMICQLRPPRRRFALVARR